MSAQPKQSKHADTVNTDTSNSFWTETLLSNFGFKCLMNKHNICTEDKCQCLCHPHNQKW